MSKKGKKYSVVEIFPTLQGEGFHTGRAAVFCRFAGCNVWTGLEKHRKRDSKKGLCALVCDTKFRFEHRDSSGGIFTPEQLAERIDSVWKTNFGKGPKMVVFTGGEPSLQLDYDLIELLKEKSFYTSVETNGSNSLPMNLDWVTLSPKPPLKYVNSPYDEVKVLYPLYHPLDFENASFRRFIQPVDDDEDHIQDCLDFIFKNPSWRLSLQTHKIIEVR